MMKRLAPVVFMLAATSAHAATGDVPFNASFGGSCVINVNSGGTLSVDGTWQNLNSLGAPGSATVYTTDGSYALSMDTPTLVRPGTDTGALTQLGGAIHISGATNMNIFDTDAPWPLNRGAHSVAIFMFASKGGSDIFTAGTYTGQSMLRCE